MFQIIYRAKKLISIVLICIILFPIVGSTSLLALTSGPTQPEFNGFSPVSSSEMVNLFTGDLNYTIPLLELPGPGGSYPFTLSYQSGITMDQEASWVGLGWSLNAGAISRQMRGLPDEFKGDTVTTVHDMLPNVTWDFGIQADYELFAKSKREDSLSKVALGLNMSHNSYKGWDVGLNLGLNISPMGGSNFGFKAGLSSSSIEGATVSGGFSYGNETAKSIGIFNVETTINSRQGLTSIDLGLHRISKLNSGITGGSVHRYSFEKQSYIPGNDISYQGLSYGGSVEIGALLGFPHVGGRVNVGYSRQEISRRGEEIGFNAFGYLHSKDRRKGRTFLLDINRSNEGPIHAYTENLAIPISTPDNFSVTGSTMSSVFRAYRSDVGIYSDPNLAPSTFSATNLGFDINPSTYIDVGANTGARFIESSNRIWQIDQKDLSNYKFTQDTLNSDHKPYYFKSVFDLAADSLNSYNHIFDNEAVRIRLQGNDIENNSKLERENGVPKSIQHGTRKNRRGISNSIQHITNKELLGSNGLSRSEYAVWIHNPDREALNRESDIPSHFAGFEIVNESGLRYIYGLPVKNKEHREYLFSVTRPSNECVDDVSVISNAGQITYKQANTDQFYQKKELPVYNHSHLLTAILGHDYADVDDTIGPSGNDIGFWVRFEYDKVDDYAWRAPYENASYLPGHIASGRDDKGSFMFGKREQYYLKTAETRTHKVIFYTESKSDGSGSRAEFTGEGGFQGTTRKLSEIHLYSKFDSPFSPEKALKRIVFLYDQSLCQGIPNGSSGKTTLKSLSFSYERSIKGEATPYQFEYSETNPSYDSQNQDRWGRFQVVNDECFSSQYSYSMQNYTEANSTAGAWSLSKITLPSGAELEIVYEADEYMYVQDKPVMQMFQITKVSTSGDPEFIEDPKVGPYKVFFDPGSENVIDEPSDIIPFIENIHGLHLNTEGNIVRSEDNQVYFKVNMVLKEGISDFVSGYANVIGYGIESDEPYIELAPFKLAGQNYHPFCAASWQKMKIEYPSIISKATFEDENQSFREVVGLFAAAYQEIGTAFRSYFSTCNKRKLATQINPELSIIRLGYPGSGKIGGNSRVKKITLDDKWGSPITLGQVFDYDILDENGKSISSGVAENEPAVGYEECALRYANPYNKQIPVHTSENLMFEYPVNESYLPGAGIGYRKVTVRSLATYLQQQSGSGLPDNFSTTGRTEYEFYTAKDFPVIFDETTVQKHSPQHPWFNSFFSFIQRHSYTGSQGYSIILNDMHGKPYRVTHYGQDKMNVENNHYTTRTEYTYYEGEKNVVPELGKFRVQRTLNNKVMTFLEYAPDPIDNSRFVMDSMMLGVDHEFFTDLRTTRTAGKDLKIGPNLVFTALFTVFGIPIPIPGVFVNPSFSENITKTAVTNRIISKTGILKQIDVYDGQSHLRTNNLIFDKITGLPVLSSINNGFDEKIYSLNIPAHYMYKGMSSSYNNYRVTFEGEINETEACNGWYGLEVDSERIRELLREDDELLLMDNNEVAGTFIIQDINEDEIYGNSKNDLNLGDYTCIVLRSGSRNMLTQQALQVNSKSNPLINIGNEGEIAFDINTPNGVMESTYIPLFLDSVISAAAFTYDRNREPLDRIDVTVLDTMDTQCLCVTATTDCDGDCAGKMYLAYENSNGDTLILDESDCFDCGGSSGSITVQFDCPQYYPVDWELFAFIEPFQSPCTESENFASCSFEMDSLYIEVSGCSGSRPSGEPPSMTSINGDWISRSGGNHWKQAGNYIYSDIRELSSLAVENELSISKEGLLYNVPIFNYDNPFFISSPPGTKWVESNFEYNWDLLGSIESYQNAIGVHSTLLKGYSNANMLVKLGNVPIMVAENAMPQEIAFEGFEDDLWIGGVPPYYLATGNLTIGNIGTNDIRSEGYRILGGIIGSPNHIVVNKQYDLNDDLPYQIILSLRNDKGEDFQTAIVVVTSQTEVAAADFDPNMLLPFVSATKYSIEWPGDCPELSDLATGEAKLIFKENGFNLIPSGFVVSNVAHTGSRSYVFFDTEVNSTYISKAQTLLNLIGGKEYILEAWMKLFNFNGPTYSYNSMSNWYIRVQDGSSLYDAIPTGQIVEGWQRIQCKFTASGSKINLLFKENPYMYYDDIRISPVGSKVKTYIYDSNKLKVLAEFDENNFATFFDYDNEGKLVLVRKETERGIMTIKENRSNIHE